MKSKLKNILEEKNISQTELYNIIKKQCKVPVGMDVISRVCKGHKTNYHTDTLLKFCLALNCTPNDLIEREKFLKTHLKEGVL